MDEKRKTTVEKDLNCVNFTRVVSFSTHPTSLDSSEVSFLSLTSKVLSVVFMTFTLTQGKRTQIRYNFLLQCLSTSSRFREIR